jgi:hypothetical protein
VIEPLRWFWRNSREAREATGECLSRDAIVGTNDECLAKSGYIAHVNKSTLHSTTLRASSVNRTVRT